MRIDCARLAFSFRFRWKGHIRELSNFSWNANANTCIHTQTLWSESFFMLMRVNIWTHIHWCLCNLYTYIWKHVCTCVSIHTCICIYVIYVYSIEDNESNKNLAVFFTYSVRISLIYCIINSINYCKHCMLFVNELFVYLVMIADDTLLIWKYFSCKIYNINIPFLCEISIYISTSSGMQPNIVDIKY